METVNRRSFLARGASATLLLSLGGGASLVAGTRAAELVPDARIVTGTVIDVGILTLRIRTSTGDREFSVLNIPALGIAVGDTVTVRYVDGNPPVAILILLNPILLEDVAIVEVLPIGIRVDSGDGLFTVTPVPGLVLGLPQDLGAIRLLQDLDDSFHVTVAGSLLTNSDLIVARAILVEI